MPLAYARLGEFDAQGQPKRDGFYDQREAMQGQKRTFYVGGIMAFELIEPIVRYSKHIAETHFPDHT
ncbi:MAG: hypothetical protein AAFX99_27655 [Myxococcota bacterium]